MLQIKAGSESAFEEIWKTRQTRLNEHAGFIKFMLLRGDTPGEYISQTIWKDRKSFDDWRESQSVRRFPDSRDPEDQK